MSINKIDTAKFVAWHSTARVNYAMEQIKQNLGTAEVPDIRKVTLYMDTDKAGNLEVVLGDTVLYSGTDTAAAKTAYEAVVEDTGE